MTFFDLNKGDEFTVAGLSGSFIKVAHVSGAFHNAVSTFDEQRCFVFDDRQVVSKFPTEVEACE